MTGRLIEGDALLELQRWQPDRPVDVVLADPPYSSGGMIRSDRMRSTTAKYQNSGSANLPEFTGDNRDQRSWTTWTTLWLATARLHVRPSGYAAVFTDWRQLPSLTDAVQAAGWAWRGLFVWHKPNSRPQVGMPSTGNEFIVVATNGPVPDGAHANANPLIVEPAPRVRDHITQKPTAVIHRILDLLPDCWQRPLHILDPFAGSGVVQRAAAVRGDDTTSIELDPHWADYCRTHISNTQTTLLEVTS